MKKMLSVALAVCMVLSLAACGKQPASSNAPGNSTPNTSAGQPKEIDHHLRQHLGQHLVCFRCEDF